MKSMQSSDRILFLLNILSKGQYSKNQILNEFKKINIKTTATSVNNYLDKLKQHSI